MNSRMSRSISPDELQLLIAGYVLNDLSSEEAAIMEQLLEDPEVVQAIEQMQQTLETVYAPPEVQPSPQLRAAVMRVFEAEMTAAKIPHRVAPLAPAAPVVWLPGWVKALGIAKAILIVALSISNFILWRSLQAQQAQVQPEALVFSLQPTDALSAPAEVVVKINPDTLQGTLNVKNLPPLEPGKVYVLWTVVAPNAPFTTDAKNAILTQVFTAEEQGNQSQQLILPRVFQNPDLVKAVAVTVEDATAPQQHNSSPILIQRL